VQVIASLFSIFCLTAVTVQAAAESRSMTEIRTYMPFTFPVDPIRISTIPDMDMSYALGSTIVEWDPQKQVSSGLAIKWRPLDASTTEFVIDEKARWSNGAPITSAQIKTSLEIGMKSHPDELRSLTNMLVSIDAPSSHVLILRRKPNVSERDLLQKLTEPNFGVLYYDVAGHPQPTISSGAFALSEASINEIVLLKNAYWFKGAANDARVGRIIIRKPLPGTDSQSLLLIDPWPNLVEVSSLIDEKLLAKYESSHFQIWRRPMDKLFFAQVIQGPNMAAVRPFCGQLVPDLTLRRSQADLLVSNRPTKCSRSAINFMIRHHSNRRTPRTSQKLFSCTPCAS
jgi:hypothetical protein